MFKESCWIIRIKICELIFSINSKTGDGMNFDTLASVTHLL